jgi:hypothetical protein
MPEGTTMNMHQWGSSVVNDACREPGGQGTNDGKLLDATSYVAPVSPEEALSFFTTTMPTEWSLITSEPGYFSTGLWRKGNLLVDMFATEFVDSSQSSVQVRRCVVGATSPDGG